ncbi:BTB/POZ domain-containing protein At4g08455-like [Rhodamnia argentea]|uniref:BTB/POZ domain-containing protein At4g08455-like n=1 Tax=Rhodamnia argentea TaxID=178133 RepID=A0A8B8QDH0_9MYRT|nr:BTB/POZ domain-containing protein At4g08455-like [Rhodamnia argentea]
MHRMRARRSHRFHHDDPGSESDSSTPWTASMRHKFREENEYRGASFWMDCYEKVSKTAEKYKRATEEHKREIEDLKAKNFFLRLWIQTDHDDLGGRSHDPGFSDVVLFAAEDGPNGGQSKPVLAHRAVLASRSPVFKAMLEHEVKESQSNTIKISEVSYDALRAFVNYLYCAEAFLDQQMAYDLLALAERYQVVHLKAYCEKFLVSKLKWDNSIVNYAFAHQHNAKLLLKAALSLIIVNKDKLKKRPEYSELIKKDPCLVVELLEACLAKQENTACSTGTI